MVPTCVTCHLFSPSQLTFIDESSQNGSISLYLEHYIWQMYCLCTHRSAHLPIKHTEETLKSHWGHFAVNELEE